MTAIDFSELKIGNELNLSLFRPEDGEALVTYLNDRAIYENTCNIPYPYEAKDAEQFIREEYFFMDTHGKWRSLAIRNNEELIGGIGLMYNYGVNSFKSELGYWLGRPFRGQGVMTAVLTRFSDYCLEDLSLVRLEANVFRKNNMGSMKVLEHAGFEQEGVLKKAFEKDGAFIDSVLYARVREI